MIPRVRVLLITAPISQLNAPYPATAYLSGFLSRSGVDVRQADASLELALRLFSRKGIEAIAGEVRARFAGVAADPAEGKKRKLPRDLRFFLDHLAEYLEVAGPALRFMQGLDPSLAYRISSRNFLPEGPTFERLRILERNDPDALGFAFGSLGLVDRAKYLCGLYIEDLTTFIAQGIDGRFALGRYGEELASSESDFSALATAIAENESLVAREIERIAADLLAMHKPELVGISAPFSGNVYGAFQLARAIRKMAPDVRIAFGGGFANTNLRDLADPRVFEFFDFVTLDDGEEPMLALVRLIEGRVGHAQLVRTWYRNDDQTVCYAKAPVLDARAGESLAKLLDFKADARVDGPSYTGLPLGSYLATCEMLNPMGRLWSDTRWNKLIVAHGCYWRKCSFCDITLDYVARYEATEPPHLVNQIESVIQQTGQTGFHFVDEAAPPTVLARMAKELKDRDLSITWWGNVRFDKAFNQKLVRVLADSGCIAVTGGLETASDRLLKLMDKGVTVEQVARVTRNFSEVGIMVHAYLIYGFPTQTVQETVDALENVRQLFLNGCIFSAYWHRFTLTAHSGVAKNPEAYGVRIIEPPGKGFARNVLQYEEKDAIDHDAFGPGLERAVYNYMHGVGLEEDVRSWFDIRLPKTCVPKNFIRDALAGS